VRTTSRRRRAALEQHDVKLARREIQVRLGRVGAEVAALTERRQHGA
jgi:hypothetical protein